MIRSFHLPLVVLFEAMLIFLVRTEHTAGPLHVVRIEFQACPINSSDCNLQHSPALYRFLKVVVENGDYPGITVTYMPGLKHPKAIMVDGEGREFDYHAIGKLSFGELERLVRNRGFRRNAEETTTAVSLPSIDMVALTTAHGVIRIKLRPEWSIESVEWVRKLALRPELCQACEFYRAEPDFILQGSLTAHFPANNVTREGPKLMERGDVGWAGGEPGPHFFIVLSKEPVVHFGLSHTVWGVVADEESMAVVEKIVMLPSEVTDPRGFPIMLVKYEPLTIDVVS